MKKKTHAGLEKHFAKWPGTRADGVSKAELTEAAKAVGVALPEDYAEFVARYGGAVVRGADVLASVHPSS